MSINPLARQGFQVQVQSVTSGTLDIPAMDAHLIDISTGSPARALARRGGTVHRGVYAAGDVDIIAAGVESHWEVETQASGTEIILLSLSPAFLRGIADQCGLDPGRIEIINRFQVREPQIEHIGLALKADLTAGHPGGRLYWESLATALAAHLLLSSNACRLKLPAAPGAGLSPGDLRRALDYISDHLDTGLSLAEMAGAIHLSPSHFTRLFRRSTGFAPHQYVITRRVEEAERLLRRGGFSVGEVAARVGFASQSHLHRHFKRVFGVSPKARLP